MKPFFCLSLGCAAVMSACAGTNIAPTSGTLLVAATFYPLAHVAEQIGKEHVAVVQLTPAGVEPHDYEPTPQDVANMHNAKIFVRNGAGVDGWADKAAAQLTPGGTVTVTATDGMDLLASDNDTHKDPHVWLDPVLMQDVAARVRDAFIAADPVHAQAYRDNADAYMTVLAGLDAHYKEGLASCQRHDLVVSHNAFAYLAKRYSLTLIAISGMSPEDEPSAKHLAEVADLAKARGVTTIFFETLASPKLAQTIANDIGATADVLNPIEGVSDLERSQGATYVTLMEHNLENLRSALACQ